MQRIFILILSLCFSCYSFAGSNYQIDMILFTQIQSGDSAHDTGSSVPMMPISKEALVLKPGNKQTVKPYQLLTPTKSNLSTQFYALNHSKGYHVLGHYSWIQPAKNQNSVALPKLNSNGWQMRGTVRVRQSAYYFFDSDIQLSPPNNPEYSYTISQKQRLKTDTVYYLDNPQLGILVKIHKLT